MRNAGNDFRKRQPDGQRRQQENEPRYGTRNTTSNSTRLLKWRPDTDERAQRARERGAQKIWRLASIRNTQAEVVSKLVRQQMASRVRRTAGQAAALQDSATAGQTPRCPFQSKNGKLRSKLARIRAPP
jgi:hypothetical protein